MILCCPKARTADSKMIENRRNRPVRVPTTTKKPGSSETEPGYQIFLVKKPRKVALGVGTAAEPGMPADWAEQAEYFGAFAVFASLLDLLRPGEALYRTPLVLCET